MDTNYIIETKNLTKQYGSQKSVADLNIHVKRGRIYGLLGRNGAGKTTTMKMLLGLTKPTSGEVKIWGKPLQGNEKKFWTTLPIICRNLRKSFRLITRKCFLLSFRWKNRA